jgi:hypothetical protein
MAFIAFQAMIDRVSYHSENIILSRVEASDLHSTMSSKLLYIAPPRRYYT